MTPAPRFDVIVIGAGIIGVSAALQLQASGRDVTVVDRKGVAAETSRGNAGAFAFTDIEPLATPGIMRKAPGWLLDPLGPLSIPPAYALKILPWLLRFWRASWSDRYQASMTAQAELMRASQAALERQIKSVDGERLMRRDGQLQLYESEREFTASRPAWDVRRQHGIVFELLESPGAIAEIQPGLHPRFTHAGFTPSWMNTCDPAVWTRHLADTFLSRGGAIDIAGIHTLAPAENGVLVKTSAGVRTAGQVVVAAGAWSHHLARMLGDTIPLETERGYNTTLPDPGFDLRTHLTFTGHGFVVTKIGNGIRVGGAVELGGLKLPPNYKRSEILLKKAAGFLNGLKTTGGQQWMGFRPSLPDSLPVIGRSPKAGRVIYAFGHGHLGLTQSAGTAELVTALANDRTPDIDLHPFSATRF
ncbi:MAG: FAD-dependent oxidoreductase [Roseibium sp.]|nr:FAD-dependent oxidoreductase [Roseibium sp.]